MYLHHDKEAFEELIVAAGNELSIDPAIIEKDYYVSIVLKKLNEKFDGIVFRGGTSLSKCYGIIERFSEDIDISVDESTGKMTEGRKKRLKQAINEALSDIGLDIANFTDTRSRRDFNRYVSLYDSIYADITAVKSEIIIETYLATSPFPTINHSVDNYIYKCLLKINRIDLAQKYDLEPFSMKVQDVQRTFIDKVFALCDYYISNEINKHSRHLYDLYMLDRIVKMDEEFKILVREVRALRSKIGICVSAGAEVDINNILDEIIESECFKRDYIDITEKILFDIIPYNVTINQLKKIVASNCF